MLFLCVNVYCHRVTTQLQLINIIIIIFHACYTLLLEIQLNSHVTKTQAMYVQGNMKARSCNHCSSGKAISIIY